MRVSVQSSAGGIARLFYGATNDQFWPSEKQRQGKIGLGGRAGCWGAFELELHHDGQVVEIITGGHTNAADTIAH